MVSLSESLADAVRWLKDMRCKRIEAVAPYFAFGYDMSLASGVPYPGETVCLVETEETLRSPGFEERRSKLQAWKRRKPNRWIALFVPAGTGPHLYTPMRRHDQVVTYPYSRYLYSTSVV